jgi:hypothetical protein
MEAGKVQNCSNFDMWAWILNLCFSQVPYFIECFSQGNSVLLFHIIFILRELQYKCWEFFTCSHVYKFDFLDFWNFGPDFSIVHFHCQSVSRSYHKNCVQTDCYLWQILIGISLREINFIIGLQTRNLVWIWSVGVVLGIVTHFYFTVYMIQMNWAKNWKFHCCRMLMWDVSELFLSRGNELSLS